MHARCSTTRPRPIIQRYFRQVSTARPQRGSYDFARLLHSHSDRRTLAQIHAQIIASGLGHIPFLASKLVSRYAYMGPRVVDGALRVFDSAPQRDVFLWNIMIRVYANAGMQVEALGIFTDMCRDSVPMNSYTYPFVINSCAALGDEQVGRAVHAHIFPVGIVLDLLVGYALVAFYSKCRKVEMARTVFDEICVKDIVSWNSVIAGYAQNDCAYEAVALPHQMIQNDVACMPDHVTLVAVLPACTALAAAQEGMWARSYAIKTGMEMDAKLASGFIGMYARCGCSDTARRLFNRFQESNLVVYNWIIQAHGNHGHALEAFDVFDRMLGAGVTPDGICFLCVLSACRHTGWVDSVP